jgi:hypothetical protein
MNAISLRTFGILALLSLAAATGCAAEVEAEESEENLTAEQKEALNTKRIVAAATANLDEAKVTFSSRVKAPKSSTSFRSDKGPSLYGVDWFQKWPGGVNADHSWSNGTDFGKRCMVASTARFEAIMKEPPAELIQFLSEYSGWSGSFYNWVDDYSGKNAEGQGASGDASNPRLWAWRTGLTKWIAQTAKDGTCLLPTRKMVVDYVAAARAMLSEDPENPGKLKGEIQGASR